MIWSLWGLSNFFLENNWSWSLSVDFYFKSKKNENYQESTQSSTTPDPGYHMGKWQNHNLISQTRAKSSAISQQVTTDAKAWQTQGK